MALSADLKREIATAQTNLGYSLFTGDEPEREDNLLYYQLGRDLTYYRDIEQDCHVSSVLTKRKLAVAAHELKVEPGGTSAVDKKAADLVSEILDSLKGSLNYNAATVEQLDALLMGYAVAEIMYEQDGKTIYPAELRSRDQRRFTFVRPQEKNPQHQYVGGYELQLFENLYTLKRDPVPDKKFAVVSFGSKVGNPFGIGLGSKLYWPVKIKKEVIKFWTIFTDKFASPTPIGTYPVGGNKSDLESFLAAISVGSWAAMPESFKVQYLEAQRSGSLDSFEKFINFWNAEISKAVLGEAISSNSGETGTYGARASAIEEREGSLTKADADLISEAHQRTLFKWVTELNYPDAKPPIVYRVFEQEEDLNQRKDRDKTLFDMGFRLKSKSVTEIYGDNYVDTSVAKSDGEGEQQQQPLVASIGVGGTQALLTFIGGLSQSGLPRENAIAVLTTVFGLTEESAAAMVPEAPPEPEQPDGLVAGGDEGADAPPATEEDIFAQLSEPEVADFAKAKAPGLKQRNCTKGKSCKGSCIAQSRVCRDDLSPQEKTEATALVKAAKSKKGKDSSGKQSEQGDSKQRLEEAIKQNPNVQKYLEQAIKPKVSDKAMREATGLTQDELLAASNEARQALGVSPMDGKDGLKRKLAEIYPSDTTDGDAIKPDNLDKYQARANEWAKKNGFETFDEHEDNEIYSHDITHQILYDMLKTDSQSLNKIIGVDSDGPGGLEESMVIALGSLAANPNVDRKKLKARVIQNAEDLEKNDNSRTIKLKKNKEFDAYYEKAIEGIVNHPYFKEYSGLVNRVREGYSDVRIVE